MNRDFDKIVASVKVNSRYDIDTVMMKNLMIKGSKNPNALFYALHDAFKYGYAMGQRSAKV